MPGLYSTTRWQRFRLQYLAEHPLCVMCEQQGKTTSATVVDHIERHGGNPVKFWAGPFQALCATHHNSTKQRWEKTGRQPGCDASGVPLDADHHWRSGKG